jgi:hypothetical protein
MKTGGLNSGEAAGQTVFHAHWHLIPRREEDFEEPRGEVRGVIGGRQDYSAPKIRGIYPLIISPITFSFRFLLKDVRQLLRHPEAS